MRLVVPANQVSVKQPLLRLSGGSTSPTGCRVGDRWLAGVLGLDRLSLAKPLARVVREGVQILDSSESNEWRDPGSLASGSRLSASSIDGH
jgi:hypothetical protein